MGSVEGCKVYLFLVQQTFCYAGDIAVLADMIANLKPVLNIRTVFVTVVRE